MYALAIRKYLEEHGFETLCPRAVLFDMDGVLYDSMPNHAIAWQESMARFQIHMTAEDAYATEGARGVDTIRMMVRIQQQREIDEPEAQKMYDEKSRLFHSLPAASSLAVASARSSNVSSRISEPLSTRPISPPPTMSVEASLTLTPTS